MMSKTADVEIKRDRRGYYTLFIAGEFAGNFDTAQEASNEAEQILYSEQAVKELVSA